MVIQFHCIQLVPKDPVSALQPGKNINPKAHIEWKELVRFKQSTWPLDNSIEVSSSLRSYFAPSIK
jgi:hypothetical protein